MKRLIIPVILLLLLCLSVAINVSYILDEDKEEYQTARFFDASTPLESSDEKTIRIANKKDEQLPQEKSSTANTHYEQLQEERGEYLQTYLIEQIGLNPKEAALALEIFHQAELEAERKIAARSEAYNKKYGGTNSYMYQAEDYVILGEARLKARGKLIELMGKKKWDELYDHIQEYNQGKFSSQPIIPIDL